METIGPGTNYDIPHGAVLLADKGYADVGPLLTPFESRKLGRYLGMAKSEQEDLTGRCHNAESSWNRLF